MLPCAQKYSDLWYLQKHLKQGYAMMSVVGFKRTNQNCWHNVGQVALCYSKREQPVKVHLPSGLSIETCNLIFHLCFVKRPNYKLTGLIVAQTVWTRPFLR